MGKIFEFSEEKIDKVVFEIKFNESAKVIDYSKSQQWQVAIYINGIIFALTSICIQYYWDAFCLIENGWFKIVVKLIFALICIGFCMTGYYMLKHLNDSVIEHGKKIEVMNGFLKIPEDLIANNINNRIKRNNFFHKVFFFSIVLVTIFAIFAVSVLK